MQKEKGDKDKQERQATMKAMEIHMREAMQVISDRMVKMDEKQEKLM